MLFAIDRPAVRIRHDKKAINDAVPSLDNLAAKVTARCAYLNPDFLDFVAHTIPKFGYAISRRHLSENDLVLANLNITTAYLVADRRSSYSGTILPSRRW